MPSLFSGPGNAISLHVLYFLFTNYSSLVSCSCMYVPVVQYSTILRPFLMTLQSINVCMICMQTVVLCILMTLRSTNVGPK